ncbi:hypothetical protein CR513_58049, partial [Mucuna pruriens]
MERNQECQESFEKVKQYLESPPVLVPASPWGAFWGSEMTLGKNKPSITSARNSHNVSKDTQH